MELKNINLMLEMSANRAEVLFQAAPRDDPRGGVVFEADSRLWKGNKHTHEPWNKANWGNAAFQS